jgi:predicted dehydrogenase
MVAHVLPFFPEFAFVHEAVSACRYGRLLGGHFTRVISKPDWSAEIGDASKTGGPAVDLHIHDTHLIGLIAGVPRGVFSTGVVGERGAVDYLTTQYLYGPEGPALSCSSGAIAQKGRQFVHGFTVYLEDATIAYEGGSLPLTVFGKDGKARVPQLKGGSDPIAAFTRELQAAVTGIRTGVEPAFLSGKLARDALVMCHKECDSVRTGKVIRI